MSGSRARELLRADVLRDYQPAGPDLEARVFTELERRPRQEARPGRSMRALQIAALVVTAAVVAAALLAHEATDGGVTVPAWAPFGGLRPPTSDMSIVDDQFVSANVGWVLVQRHVTSGPTVLFKTGDGGRHWTEQLYFADGTGGVAGMRFWPDGHGMVGWLERPAGPTPIPSKTRSTPTPEVIFRTADGGAHWSRSIDPLGLTVGSRFFVDPDQGWGIERPLPVNSALLVRTVDGGSSWQPVADLTAAGIPPTPNGSLVFRDASVGWLTVADSRVAGADASGVPFNRVVATTYLYVTRDGGQTWAGQALPLPPEAVALDVRVWAPVFFGRSDALLPVQAIDLTGPIGTPGGGARSYLLRSADGGQTWAPPVELPGGMDRGGELLLGPRHWLIGDGANLRETLDGGQTWTSRRVLAGDGDALSLAPWSYIDQRTIWSQVGANGLVRSLDGGGSWSVVRPPMAADVRPRRLPGT
ncbi:MAG TPA: hypothetical protein VE953_10725 [Terriglobales bacterium]|nr:hypothetical protein [Terriglobales bacterium]